MKSLVACQIQEQEGFCKRLQLSEKYYAVE